MDDQSRTPPHGDLLSHHLPRDTQGPFLIPGILYPLGLRENRSIKGRSLEELERQFSDEELMEIARFGRVVSDTDS